MDLIDKIAWIYLKDRKILSTRSKGKDVWYLPGGKREPGESDRETLIREIREELSVNLLPYTLQYLGIFKAQAHGKPEGVFVQMTCYTGEYEGDLVPSMEVEEIAWHDSTTNLSILSPVDKIILAHLKEKDLID
ncbi:DNA mismatch repair protein MutT [Candidatus Roizmanbacteria bacterium RIFCSPHIGHO2_02_FULL_40_13b]|uniref:DNA mismatch repair protein MutT n=1 Tax=Candidatus Roizmanbacteria bacterium RIFCSPHIGHO2_01_FULL_39_24 TaxID=1802032 RepID=A0A1F7GKR1_9BACT|nr:MAG: DNA mismatch repair protein MutT [Candidatus Roizmanbacteria bacterium RIFCSPHIGHO2_01_FULL_39_24]OGK27453.1 MAG: DNA mismatch repair protein MutT [Candidatus Roizmanbacteria bacterium RIFCSPHIGHO2_02_FULL_40_13b]OGK50010.1 MAG: DNA mismatch repair protein MutT [Candidatus Roizmanbacteria bacterium RIFCSPLOWO2_01_FULL_40_32]OGK56533.1 MAG: DNA mismatch repair protein MutT [Candidatus Roizmanbacteria bacterium RIFCSPLOWO2_02_FULL_39_8]